MIDFDMSTVIISLVFLLISLLYLKYKRKIQNVYLVFFSIFFIYLIGVLKSTIFPIPLDPYMREVMIRETTFLNGINIIPLKIKSLNVLLHKQLILNIILSIPFGFGISYIKRITKYRLIFYGILFGATIEVFQLLISLLLGFTYRYIDINDVILNFIGVIIGYYIFKLFSLIIIKLVNKFNLKLDPILNYIYITAKDSMK